MYIIENDNDRRWKQLCTSCDVKSSSSEKYAGKKTLLDCQKSCREEASCTAIDYGKGPRSMQCYHNYGREQRHSPHSNFDAYILEGYF